MPQGNIQKCETAKNLLVDVFSDEAKDELYDNGNLTTITEAIKGIENIIECLKKRLPPDK